MPPEMMAGMAAAKVKQKEKLDQFITVSGRQLLRANKETGAVGHAITHQKVHHSRNGKIHQYLDQRIDLVLATHGAELQKCKTGMHGQHHDCAEENEQGIRALF